MWISIYTHNLIITRKIAKKLYIRDMPRAAGKEIRLSQEKSVGSADFKPY